MKVLCEIFKTGFSRVPVYEKDRNDIIGLLFAKDLIFADPEVRRLSQGTASSSILLILCTRTIPRSASSSTPLAVSR